MSRRASPPRDYYATNRYASNERPYTSSYYPIDSRDGTYESRYPTSRSTADRAPPSAVLASVQTYDKDGRKISSYAPPAYKESRVPGRRPSLNTGIARQYDDRLPPAGTHIPTSATRSPAIRDRDLYDQYTAHDRRRERQLSAVDDTRTSRDVVDRRRESEYAVPRRRRDSVDSNPRQDGRAYRMHDDRLPTRDDRGSHDYSSRRELSDRPDPRRHGRTESLDYGSRDRRKPLAIEYPEPSVRASRDAPSVATRGGSKLNPALRSDDERAYATPSPLQPISRGHGPSPDEEDDYRKPQRQRPKSGYYDQQPLSVASPTRGGFEEHEDVDRPRRKHDPETIRRGFGFRDASAEPPRDRDESIDRSSLIPAGMLSSKDAAAQQIDDRYPPKASGDRRAHRPRHKDELSSSDADRPPNGRRRHHDSSADASPPRVEKAAAAGGGLAALAAGAYASRRRDKGDRSDRDDRDEDSDGRRNRDRRTQMHDESDHDSRPQSSARTQASSRPKDDRSDRVQGLPGASLRNDPLVTQDAEDDYQARERRAMEMLGLTQPAKPSSEPAVPEEEDARRDPSPAVNVDLPPSSARSRYMPKGSREVSREASPSVPEPIDMPASYRPPEVEPLTDTPYSEEPEEIPMSPTNGKRVAIVEPSKEEEKKPKGILKQRTTPFKDFEPEEIGVKPHKTAKPIPGAKPDDDKTFARESQISTTVLDYYGQRYVRTYDEKEEEWMLKILRVVPPREYKKFIRKTQEERDGKPLKPRNREEEIEDEEDEEQARNEAKEESQSQSQSSRRDRRYDDEEDDNKGRSSSYRSRRTGDEGEDENRASSHRSRRNGDEGDEESRSSHRHRRHGDEGDEGRDEDRSSHRKHRHRSSRRKEDGGEYDSGS